MLRAPKTYGVAEMIAFLVVAIVFTHRPVRTLAVSKLLTLGTVISTACTPDSTTDGSRRRSHLFVQRWD